MLKRNFDLWTEPLGRQPDEPAAASRVGQVRAVRDVRGHRCAPGQPAVAAPGSAGPPRGRPPQWLGAVPERHQAGAPDTQTPTTVAPL